MNHRVLRGYVGLTMVAAVAGLTLMARGQMSNQSPGQIWAVDAVHSSVVFKLSHMGLCDFYGNFEQLAGSFTTGPEAGFDLTIPIKSIHTRNQQRDAHLMSPDFFDAAQFPDMRFKSTRVTIDGDTYHVTGDLTLHGVTKSIDVTMIHGGQLVDPMKMTRTGFNVTFTIRRSDFGINYGLDMIGDEVTLMIGLQGTLVSTSSTAD
ncbi:MAG: YceI family protein [Phycisphaeraceae bacterium]|nr:YceI family protein [Phycisphaeraceae bacterium]